MYKHINNNDNNGNDNNNNNNNNNDNIIVYNIKSSQAVIVGVSPWVIRRFAPRANRNTLSYIIYICMCIYIYIYI